MIIVFNPSIFDTQDPKIQSTLADILVNLLEDKHFLDFQSISQIFFDDNNRYIFNEHSIAQNFLSSQAKRYLKEYLSNSQKSITQIHRNHLTQITIGHQHQQGEVSPQDAYRILTERSRIIVENAISDWNFIKGICQKYSNAKRKDIKRCSIYKLLNQAIIDEQIEPENAGGVGEITRRTQELLNKDYYQNIDEYKLMAIFDSDKPNAIAATPNKSQIEYFKNKQITTLTPSDYQYDPRTDRIIWHILYKRKIENYIPLKILYQHITSISEAQKQELEKKSIEELDFITYNKDNLGLGEAKIKDQLPKIFVENFSYRELEKRCEHHKIFLSEANEEVSEIEQILLKIAKII